MGIIIKAKVRCQKGKGTISSDMINNENTVFYIDVEYSPSWNIAKYSTTVFWNIFKFYSNNNII